jgi:hypothetical protein
MLTSRDLKYRESDEPLTEYALVPAPEPEHVSRIGIYKPKKSISFNIKSSDSIYLRLMISTGYEIREVECDLQHATKRSF